jgi:hypothetical protein
LLILLLLERIIYFILKTKKSEHSSDFQNCFTRIASLNFFPNDSFKELEETNADENFDPNIASVCIKEQNFLSYRKGTDQQKSTK